MLINGLGKQAQLRGGSGFAIYMYMCNFGGAHCLHSAACEILVPKQGLKTCPLYWKHVESKPLDNQGIQLFKVPHIGRSWKDSYSGQVSLN